LDAGQLRPADRLSLPASKNQHNSKRWYPVAIDTDRPTGHDRVNALHCNPATKRSTA
jgi:hypothetical protein